MRLPITPQVSTKDGTSNKNARLTNCLKEAKKSGDKAVIRPGLVLSDTYSGLGNGLIEFDGRLLVVYDDTVTDVVEDSFPWPLDSDPWASGTTYDFGDAVWYNGNMWFSTEGSNTGNTPGTGTEWARSYETPEWDEDATYAVGEPVRSGGITYYLYASSSTNQPPASNPTLWRTTAPNLNLTMGAVTYSPAISLVSPTTQTASWTIYDGATPVGTGNGTLTSTLADSIATLTASNWPRTSTTSLGNISDYQAMPATPPNWTFSGGTFWSGLPGYDNFSWSPTQSSGSWTVLSV